MINERYGIAITETLHYLKGINQEDINKIPKKFMVFLKENASKNYSCNFDYTKPLKDLDLLSETRGLIAMICLNYWCETDEQKKVFVNKLNENELKHQEDLRKLYNPDDIFKSQKSINKDENIDINKLPIKVEQEKIFKRIFNRIMKLFHTK